MSFFVCFFLICLKFFILRFALIFIVLFIPPLVLFIVQIVRAVKFQKIKGTYRGFFWVHLKDRPDRFNMHLTVKLGFAIICVVRVIQGFLFVISTLINQESLELDRVIRFWIDYINFNFLFTAVSGIIYYLVDLGLASIKQIGKREIFSKRLTIFFIVINVVFHIVNIVLLATLAKEEGKKKRETKRKSNLNSNFKKKNETR